MFSWTICYEFAKICEFAVLIFFQGRSHFTENPDFYHSNCNVDFYDNVLSVAFFPRHIKGKELPIYDVKKCIYRSKMMNFFVLLWKFYFFYLFGVKVRRLSDKHLKGGRGEIHFWQTTFLKKIKSKKEKEKLIVERKKERK